MKNKLLLITSMNDDDNKRKKRGLFNFVGPLFKYLYGIMSADDAERIDQQIDAVYSNTGLIAKLLQNQTAILKKNLLYFKEVS